MLIAQQSDLEILLVVRGVEQTTNHPSVSRTDKCDLFCLFKKTPIPGKQCFHATEVKNIVEDRLKILGGLAKPEGHA